MEEMKRGECPMVAGGTTLKPYDCGSNFVRGTRGTMMDMYRHPKQLEQVLDRLLPMRIRIGVRAAKGSGIPRVMIPLHKGQEGFMSMDQYKRFYWPGLRQLMMALIEEGITPCPLVEGHYSSRLGLLADVPSGKVLYAFESTEDVIEAKKALNDVACVRGGVPISLLCTGSPDEVRAHCKKLIEDLGEDGGFILDASTGLDDAKPENVRAMFEFTQL